MALKAEITVQDPKGKSDSFPCSTCNGEPSQTILTIVNTHEFSPDGLVQFWNHYLTVRCNGCGTVNFCRVSSNSEEESFDNQGRPSLVQHKEGYPQITEKKDDAGFYVDPSRISALASLPRTRYDTTKLVLLLTELNRCYQAQLCLSCIYLVRAILDHVPPVFDLSTFSQVASNYGGGGKSFREAMDQLQNSSRKIADAHLHSHIREVEVLPTMTQVEFRPAVDMLLSEVIRVLQPKP